MRTLAPVRPSNPARLSRELAGLFPPGVTAAELAGDPPQGLLSGAEAAVISHCSDKRIRDFTAGRLCARRALEEFGVRDFALLPAPDRTALWPPPLLGSITHTEGYSAAVLARREDFAGLGVDSERLSAVHEELWTRICTPPELGRLQGLPPQQRAGAATLVFAAKEAFYKCQYPLTGEWLEFEDLEIASPELGSEAGEFFVLPRRALRLGSHPLAGWRGRFHTHGAYLSCGVALGV